MRGRKQYRAYGFSHEDDDLERDAGLDTGSVDITIGEPRIVSRMPFVPPPPTNWLAIGGVGLIAVAAWMALS